MDNELLETIVCPKCKGKLIYDGENLICSVCNLRFRVIDGIPDMILDHAEKN